MPPLALTCGDQVISVKLGQYHGCWCPGSSHRQDISSHDIDYVEYVGPGLTWGRISSICVVLMWSNYIKCKYMFMFPLQNLARKGLKKKSCENLICLKCTSNGYIRSQLCWVNIDSGNDLLPDGTKPLPEPMLTCHQWGSVAFTWEELQRNYSRY